MCILLPNGLINDGNCSCASSQTSVTDHYDDDHHRGAGPPAARGAALGAPGGRCGLRRTARRKQERRRHALEIITTAEQDQAVVLQGKPLGVRDMID